jgi:predicted enzyme related to lactoylglutathione lyase
MPRVIHFEIHATNPLELIPFYESLFGWTLTRFIPEVEYWTIVTGTDDQPGINGGLVKRQGPAPVEMQSVNGSVCTVQVESVDQILTKNAELGGSVALPKMPIPGIGWLAYIKDLDGNILGIMNPDPTA